MSTNKTENRGGRRKGAGRKPIFELSDSVRREIIVDVMAEAEANGTSIGRVMGQAIFKPGGDQRYKTQHLQTFLRDVLAKQSETDVAITAYKVPQIFVPEKYPDSDEAPVFEPAELAAAPLKKKSND